MPAFPRTVLPKRATWPSTPTGISSSSRSGKVQRRTDGQIGRRWTETYGPLKASTAVNRAWLALVESYYRNMTTLTVDHRSMRSALGSPGGTPLVNGAAQTGSSLISDGWTPSTLVLRGGDIITIAGLTPVYTVTADATANGSGQVTLALNPPLYTAPADNAAITTNATPGSVLFTAYIATMQSATGDEAEFYDGFSLTFVELP